MGYKLPREDLKDELIDIAGNIANHKFETLAPGIGLGRVVPVFRQKGSVISKVPHATEANPQSPSSRSRSNTSRISTNQTKPHSPPGGVSIFRTLSAHGLDLLIVSVSMIFCLLLVGQFTNGQPQWLLLKTMQQLGTVKTIIALYGAYLAYWLFFFIINGTTIGGGWIGSASRKKRIQAFNANIERKNI